VTQILAPSKLPRPFSAPVQLTLPNNGILAFAANASVPADAAHAPYIQFPLAVPQVSGCPGIRVLVHNLSVATPIIPTLLNADGSIFATFSMAEPGGGWTSSGVINETAMGLPFGQLKLALQNIVTGDAAGFNVYALAWAV
jgi:hypothetical protein